MLRADVSRCAGRPGPGVLQGPAGAECRTCARWLAGLEVKPVAVTFDKPVPWRAAPSERPCPVRLEVRG